MRAMLTEPETRPVQCDGIGPSAGHSKTLRNGSHLWGDPSHLWGDPSRLYGDGAMLSGNASRLYGDCSWLRGNCTGVKGNCTGISGDLDACELSPSDRKQGVDIRRLVTAAAISPIPDAGRTVFDIAAWWKRHGPTCGEEVDHG
jgi:hypothetical protein